MPEGLLRHTSLDSNPVTASVQDNQLTSYHVDKLTAKDSPLRQRAETSGKNYSVSRGLLNTGSGAGHAFGAFLDRVTPIASEDGKRFGQVADMNTTNQNAFNLANKNYLFSASLQDSDQKWRSGENVLDRTFTTSERVAGQNFVAGEGLLDRNFRTTERVAGQNFTASQSELDRLLNMSESEKNRSLERYLQQTDQGFRAGESAMDRILTMSEAEKNRLLEQSLQSSDQSWRTAENLADRSMTMSENEKSRLLEQYLQSTDQGFRAGESAADRLLTMSESEKNRLLETALQSQDQSWRTGENAADRAMTQTEGAANRTLTQTENAADRTLSREEIESRERISADQSRTELERMGYNLQLDKLQLNASTQNQIQTTLLTQIMGIQSDPNLDPESKKNAIMNAQDAAKSMATAISSANAVDVVMPFSNERASNILVDEARKMGLSNPTTANLDMALQHARANNLTEQQMRAYVRSFFPGAAG